MDGVRIGVCVQIKQQHLIILPFFLSFVHGYFNINPKGWSGGIASPPPFDPPSGGTDREDLLPVSQVSCSDPPISPEITGLTQDILRIML